MFQNLPLEITLNIARNLEFKDKLNLKTTCQKLNDQIAKAVLFEELDLLDPKRERKSYEEIKEDNDRMIQKLINKRFECVLVKVLCLNIDSLSGPQVSQLSDLFPNVNRVITAKREKQYVSLLDYNYPPKFKNGAVNPLTKWRNAIEKIDFYHDWRILQSDILWSKYPRLTELDFSGHYNVLNFCIRNPEISFFTNAPLLTTLTLHGVEINVKILEAIHSGFPLLNSFRLFDPQVTSQKDKTLPPSIAPASTVLFLGIYNPQEFYKHGVILDYISKKYTNLQQLVYSIDPEYDYSIKTRDDFERDYVGFREENDDEFEKRVVSEIAKSESTFPIYSAAESAFFSSLPKTIKFLTLHIGNVENAVAAIVESDMELTMLDLLKSYYYLRCKRIRKNRSTFSHFKKLPSLKTLRFISNVLPETLTPEIISFGITRLCIDVLEETFYIDWVLSKFPLLEELTINTSNYSRDRLLKFNAPERHGNNSHGSIDEEAQLKQEHPHLRILTIAKFQIQTGLFDFLKTLAPRLAELNVKVSPLVPSALNTATEKMNLSNWNLNRLNISFEDFYSGSTIHCIVTVQNISKHVLIDSYKGAVLSTASIQRKQNSCDKSRWIEIISDPIEHLKIFHYRVVKIGNKILFDI